MILSNRQPVSVRSVARAAWRGLKQTAYTTMTFLGRSALWLGSRLPGSLVDYGRVGDGRHNSILQAVIGWIARNSSEAPVVVKQLVEGEWKIVTGHPMSSLIERPNDFIAGPLMMEATAVDRHFNGNAYWLKVRDPRDGIVKQLWWVPQFMMEPHWPLDGTEFIDYYEYRPDPQRPKVRIETRDVVHFRKGLDPHNYRRGLSPVASLVREIFTDDEAANYTATLLKNMGVPAVVLWPTEANAVVEDPDDVAEKYREKFTGDNRGGAMVMTGPTGVQILSFNPQQMNLRDLRRVPEERVSAVYGVAAIVAGLGAGLDRSTFANYAEARQAAYEECIIPDQRTMAGELEIQLLPDFVPDYEVHTDEWDVDFDLSDVRVLADDVDALWKRHSLAVSAGWETVATAKRATGQPVLDGDEVYLRALTVVATAAGTPVVEGTPIPGAKMWARVEPKATTNGNGHGLKKQRTDAAKRPDVRATMALRKRLVEVVQPKLLDDIRAYFGKLERKILPTVKASGIEWDPEEDVDWDVEGQLLDDILRRAYGAAGEEIYAKIGAETGVELTFDFGGKGGAKLLDRIGTRVKGITETTRQELAQLVSDAKDKGYTAAQLRNGVPEDGFTGLKDLMDGWRDLAGSADSRAELIARTELANAAQWDTVAAYADSGVVEQVEVFDGDSDEECAAADGEIWSLDEADANPIEHPNCVRAFAPIFAPVEA